jgi:thioredoxin 1
MVKKIIKMSASWCMPCRVYSKTFNDVKNKDKYKNIVFEEIDVDENEEMVNKYKVRGVPTTIILGEEEKVLSIFSGNVPKNFLEDKIDELENGQVS